MPVWAQRPIGGRTSRHDVQFGTAQAVPRPYIPRMGMIEHQPPVSDDHDRVRPSNDRKTLEELVRQAEVLRCSTREGADGRLKQIEAELSLLLDAELIRLEREPEWPV
jgi:hypothetical protein